MRASSLVYTAKAQWKPVFTLRHVLVQRPLRRHNHTHTYDAILPKPRSIKNFLEWKPDREVRDVVVDGWVRSVRAMKKRAFVTLGDGSSLAPLQAVVSGGDLQGYDFVPDASRLGCSCFLLTPSLRFSIATGAAVRLSGSWCPSEGAGQSHELHVDAVQVLGPSDASVWILYLIPMFFNVFLFFLLINPSDYRHFQSRKSTSLQNFCELCLISGREPRSTQLFLDSGPKSWQH